MAQARGRRRPGRFHPIASTIAFLAIVLVTGSCGQPAPGSSPPSPAVLRVGLGQISSSNPVMGFRQVSQLLSVEALGRPGEDGRMVPTMAESWAFEADGRVLTIKLRPNIKFHDGSRADAATVASLLPAGMGAFMGPVFSDVESIKAAGPDSIAVTFRERSPFLVESLDAQVQKPNGTATGPFKTVPNSTTEIVSNEEYYLGPPNLQRIHLESFPSIRTAWAEMLRGRIDMLWEVGPDALPSMQNASTASIFTFTRRYQYVIILNPQAPALKSAAVRRGLSMGVNREEVVRTALNGYGVVSSGPVWPKYWASKPDAPKFGYDPGVAAKTIGRRLQFTCLMPTDAPFERIALEVKRQLAEADVDMRLEQVSIQEQAQRAATGQYEALLTEVISGPTFFRPYIIWHSNAPFNWGKFGTQTSDAALDRVRHAGTDQAYREAVAALQQNFVDDPPAIFLAWSVRARAVSKRFVVPVVEPGREVNSTLRLWKPTADDRSASPN
jgi:peptide/nickel transport system substrate-binding protein